MTNSARLALAASLLLTGSVAAQETERPAVEAAMRDAERFAACVTRNDVSCFQALTHLDALVAAGLWPTNFDRQTPIAAAVVSGQPGAVTYDFEIARPWEPFPNGSRLVAFVPYFESYARAGIDARSERMAYLIGMSEDEGESWRFIPVNNLSSPQPDEVDRLLPGSEGVPRPEVHEFLVRDTELARSRWLQTTQRGFAVVDGAFAYDLKFQVRREIEEPLELTIRYDNPADRDLPWRFDGLLLPGQQELVWQSPAFTAFESGAVYDVVIEASDPDTGDPIFEHRQSLLFQPNREIWRAVMSKRPAGQP